MFAVAASLAALTLAGGPIAAAAPPQAGVRISLNGGDYQPGDRVRVQVATDDDGYLIVFRADADGYLRVLFPLDPDLDPFVRGGREYELRGRGDHESFLADDRGGTGMVFAILAREPLNFGGYAAGMHWDYERLRLDDPYGDVEAQLLAIGRRMTDNGRFDHDAVGYRVWGPGYEEAQPTIVAGGGYDPYLDGRYSCLACGWGYPGTGIGVSIGLGGGWYDPWYDPWNDPWRHDYRRSHYGWNGYWGWDPYWGTPYRPITVINTYPRPTVPNAVYGTRTRPRQPVPAGVGTPRLSDPVRPAPRPANDGRSRRRGETPAPTSTRPSGRGETPAPSRGGTASPTPSTPAPSSSGQRSRSRRPESASTVTIPAPAVTPRNAEERPVYRPPVAVPSRPERRVEPSARPTSSPPPRQATPSRAPERRATPTRVERPAPERRSAPTRVERPAPSRAPVRSSPPPRVERPSSPPASSGSAPAPRSRSRGKPVD